MGDLRKSMMMQPVVPLKDDEIELRALQERDTMRLQVVGKHASAVATAVLRVGFPLQHPAVALVRAEHQERIWEFPLSVDSPRRLVLSQRPFPDSVLYAANHQPARAAITFMQVGALVEVENAERRARYVGQDNEVLARQYLRAVRRQWLNGAEELFDELTERGWIYDAEYGDFVDSAEWNARH